MRNILFALIAILSIGSADASKNIWDKSALGKRFLIAFPPNEMSSANLKKQALEVYITAPRNTFAYITTSDGRKLRLTINALQVTTLSAANGELTWDYEVYESESPVRNKSFLITSDDSVSVFVLNNKEKSSDGYLALPTASWGKEYVHTGFYENVQIVSGKAFNRGTGFLVIADSNDTELTLVLKGVGTGQSVQGRKLGDTIKVKLKAGEIYPVKSTGKNSGSFDLTGSYIKSDKPVGVISFHERACVPARYNPNGKNHLAEMIPPINTWGQTYYTLEFKRNGQGDFFRVISAFDDTKWSVKSYDLTTKQLIYQNSGTLNKFGDFWEFNNIAIPENGAVKQSIKGVSVWTADKPIFVMQYSYSQDWDNSLLADPFMVFATSEQQYVRSSIFQTPSGNNSFNDNYINILAVGDSTDNQSNKLKSLKLDGTPLSTISNNFASNRIPGTNIYWLRLSLSKGAHYIEGDTKFGATIYGYDDVDAYGWPASLAFDILAFDTLSPHLSYTEDCNEFTIRIADSSYLDLNLEGKQRSSGIKSVELLPVSMNFEIIDLPEFSDKNPINIFDIKVRTIDAKKQAFARVKVTDWFDNENIIEFEYPNSKDYWLAANTNLKSDSLIVSGERIGAVTSIMSPFKYLYSGDFSIIYRFPANYFRFDNSYELHQNIPTSDFSIKSVINNDKTNDIVFDFKNTSISLNDSLLTVHFESLLNDSKTLYFETLIDMKDSEYICSTDSDRDELSVELCNFDLRQVVLSDNYFGLDKVSPNPILSNTLNIQYSLGFDCSVNLQLINAIGETINILNDFPKTKGTHYEQLDVTQLPVGVYYIKFVAADYHSIEKVRILR